MDPVKVNNISSKDWLLTYSIEKYENAMQALKSRANEQKSLTTVYNRSYLEVQAGKNPSPWPGTITVETFSKVSIHTLYLEKNLIDYINFFKTKEQPIFGQIANY